MNAKKIDQAFYILQNYTLLKEIAKQVGEYAETRWGATDQSGVFLQVGDFRITVFRDATISESDGKPTVKIWYLWSYSYRVNAHKVMGKVDASTVIEILKGFFTTGEFEMRSFLPPLLLDDDDLRYLGELTGQDFIGYAPGDKVLYIPNHATGADDPVCERGVVSSVEGEIGSQKVWVKYGSGDTGQLTPLKNLRRL